MDAISSVEVPILNSNIEKVVDELESYTRWRKTTTQVNHMALLNLDSIIPIASKEKESYQRLTDAINFSVNFNDNEDTFNFSIEEDYERAKERSSFSGSSLKSTFNLINRSLQNSGYVPGELTMFVAPPNCGKTTALSAESLEFVKQGKKVLHYILGDLTSLDVLHKYIANFLNKSVNSVLFDCDALLKTAPIHNIVEKVLFKEKAAYELDVDELYNDAIRVKDTFDYDAIIIDYDGNIRKGKDDSLYEDGGYTYGRVRQLSTHLGVTTLIGSQPKITSWSKDILSLESANDSSKKQHHVDNMITLSKPDISVPIGIMSLAKVRRGDSGRRNCICYFNNCATLLEISLDEYNKISAWYEKNDNITAEKIFRQWGRQEKGLDIAA